MMQRSYKIAWVCLFACAVNMIACTHVCCSVGGYTVVRIPKSGTPRI